MIIDFQTEAAKRRETVRQPGGMPERRTGPKLFEARPAAGGSMWPAVDCGSGWYHADAMQAPGTIRSLSDRD